MACITCSSVYTKKCSCGIAMCIRCRIYKSYSVLNIDCACCKHLAFDSEKIDYVIKEYLPLDQRECVNNIIALKKDIQKNIEQIESKNKIYVLPYLGYPNPFEVLENSIGCRECKYFVFPSKTEDRIIYEKCKCSEKYYINMDLFEYKKYIAVLNCVKDIEKNIILMHKASKTCLHCDCYSISTLNGSTVYCCNRYQCRYCYFDSSNKEELNNHICDHNTKYSLISEMCSTKNEKINKIELNFYDHDRLSFDQILFHRNNIYKDDSCVRQILYVLINFYIY